jgi:2-iminobutanoate/2-iminopropanoate deaminase
MPASIKTIETKNAPSAIGPYSQAVKTGGLLFVSGQIPLDPATGKVVEGGISEQTQQVMKNISAILVAAGTGFGNAVKCTIFLKNLGDFTTVNEIYGSYFTPPYPARACVEVAKLPRDVLVEIEIIAQV